MNANEVIANRAGADPGRTGSKVHPNDHVNMGQSSNDVIPTAIHVAACLEAQDNLLPALAPPARRRCRRRPAEFDDVVKTGRTHLMDAMPIRLGQEIGGWAAQVDQSIERIEASLPRVGAAAHRRHGGRHRHQHPSGVRRPRSAGAPGRADRLPFIEADNHFAAQAAHGQRRSSCPGS